MNETAGRAHDLAACLAQQAGQQVPFGIGPFANDPPTLDSFCRAYAYVADRQVASQLVRGCGYTGPRWDGNFDNHRLACMGWGGTSGQNAGDISANEMNGRSQDLVACEVRGAGLSADQQAILNAHNFYRAKHCVPLMTWSSDLANGAQSWANGCKQNNDVFVHSGVPGENLHWSWPVGSEPAKAAVDDWYNEIHAYNFNNPGFSSATGHFTQVVWRGSTQLGCARATCKTSHGDTDYWVCRYSPPGNIQGQFPANIPAACK